MKQETKDVVFGLTCFVWAMLVLIIGILNLQSITRIEKLLTPVEGVE